jgi:hypothetical protein
VVLQASELLITSHTTICIGVSRRSSRLFPRLGDFSLIFSFFDTIHRVFGVSSSSLRSGDFSHMIKVITVHGSTNSSKKKISTYRATFDGF